MSWAAVSGFVGVLVGGLLSFFTTCVSVHPKQRVAGQHGDGARIRAGAMASFARTETA